MRTVKMLLVCLFALPLLLVLGQDLFPALVVEGQAGATLTAPTGVAASDNAYSTKVGLTWDAVRGATVYRVFRNTSNDTASALSLGTTAAGSFFDTTAPAGQTFFYWVRAENGATLSPMSQPDQGTRAGGLTNFGPVPPLNPPPAPPGNPVTASKAFLGKAIFWDEQLSSTRTVSCGTCHLATRGGSDSRSVINSERATNPGADLAFGTADDVTGSPGVPANNADGTYNWSSTYGFREQVTGRKSRSYVDAAYSNTLFWDGRATPVFTDPVSGAVVLQNGAALESQVTGPPVNASEMAHSFRDWTDVAARVAASRPLALSPSVPQGLNDWIAGRTYPELFAEVFGTSDVTPARIALAVATFERTVYSDRTPFDAAVSQIAPLTPAEARGQAVFNQSRCNTCHAGTLFTDNQFHNIGLRPQAEDTGRFQVTGNVNDMGEFRTPSLRNVELRAPYFHNGRFASLEAMVEFYNRGGDFDAPNVNHNLIRPLNLTPQQKADLVAFLRRPLTDPRVASGTAPFDRPTLYTESNRVPQLVGTGTAGTGGHAPRVTAIEPPAVGNPRFTVAVSNALGGAQAVLVVDRADPGTGPAVPQSAGFARVGLQLQGGGAGQGFGSVSLQIPDSAALIGSTFVGRWFVSDPAAPGGVAVTPAFRFTVFGTTSAGLSSPIDDAQFFVEQHYNDFLSREPDQSGLDFWTGQTTGCGDPDLLVCRINVSAAFFLSGEFQQTGFLAYRVYKAAYGNIPGKAVPLTFAEFQPDTQKLGAGVVVGQPGADERLEANTRALMDEFITRQRFTAAYPQTLTPRQFVDALNANAGGALTQSEAESLASELASGAKTRAQVLRAVAENAAFTSAERNRAFVLAEYFGYLRRDPDDNGYNFWLGKLNDHGGDYIRAEMVKAFITSDEYRARFAF